ncbi:hypothetical protein BGK72_34785 [Streptomyces agglomeratus]|nr:hypothetical protein BGK72_34785 [Streptomyces agglomeratus]
MPGVDLAGLLGVGVVERVDVPAAVLGELRNGVFALGQQPPQLLGEPTPPGNRQLMPTMAIGSWSRASSSRTRRRTWRRSVVARLR